MDLFKYAFQRDLEHSKVIKDSFKTKQTRYLSKNKQDSKQYLNSFV